MRLENLLGFEVKYGRMSEINGYFDSTSANHSDEFQKMFHGKWDEGLLKGEVFWFR